MPFPWSAILTHGPALVAAAQSLLATQTRKVNERQQSFETRLDELEKASVESARLLQEIAQQIQALTVAQQQLEKRLRVALVVGVVGMLVGASALAMALAG